MRIAAALRLIHGSIRSVDALPDYLKPLFVTASETGVREGELLKIRWDHGETKNQHGRIVPIFEGDRAKWLRLAQDIVYGCPYVFSHAGERRVFPAFYGIPCGEPPFATFAGPVLINRFA